MFLLYVLTCKKWRLCVNILHSIKTEIYNTSTLPDYILFCLCRGYIKDEPIAQQQINDITPNDFINTIKPSWTSAKYKNFVSWLDRRVKTGKDDSITALEGSWKIKVPDILKPDNPGFVDTSVGIQSDRKKKR